MPHSSEWCEPELFLEHRGVSVWHTYKNDDISEPQRSYWYTLNQLCGEGTCTAENCSDSEDGCCCNVFDVRDLTSFDYGDEVQAYSEECRRTLNGRPNEEEFHKLVIRKAIEADELTKEGVVDLKAGEGHT